MNYKVKKGDTVRILAGKDRGKTGVIERMLPKTGKLVVTGINIVKKHSRPKKRTPHGGVISLAAPFPISRVMLVCPRCAKPTRVAIQIDGEGKRHRMCKQCHETITA